MGEAEEHPQEVSDLINSVSAPPAGKIRTVGTTVGFTPEAPISPPPVVAEPEHPKEVSDLLSSVSPYGAVGQAQAAQKNERTDADEGTQDMGDFMMAPSILKNAMKSPMSVLGMVASDRDSFENIYKSLNPDAKTRHDKHGNLVLTEDGKDYVFKPGAFQIGDAIRGVMGAGAGTVAAGAVGAGLGATLLAAPAAVGGAIATGAGMLPAWLAGTGGAVATHAMLAKMRERAGGAPLTPWELAGAAAVHHAVHGTGQVLRGMAREAPANGQWTGAKAPGGVVVPPEGTAVQPGGLPGAPLAAAAPEAGAAYSGIAGIPHEDVSMLPGMRAAPEPTAPQAPAVHPPEAPLPPQPDFGPSMQSFRDKAKNVLTRATKTLDRSEQNSAVGRGIDKDLFDMQKRVEDAFRPIDEAMKGKGTYNPKSIGYLDQLEKENGRLSPSLERIRNELSSIEIEDAPPKLPPYGALDRTRKIVGNILKNLKGGSPDMTVTKSEAMGLIGPLLEDQKDNITRYANTKAFKAKYPGLENALDHAHDLFKQEKQLASDLADTYGEKVERYFPGGTPPEPPTFTKDMMPALGKSLDAMSEDGSTAAFNKIAPAIPKRFRSDSIMSAFASKFGDLSRGEPPDLPAINKWYKGMLSNGESMKTFMAHLEPDAQKAMGDVFKVSEEAAGHKAQLEFAQGAAKEALKDAQERLAAASKASIEAQKSASETAQKSIVKGLKGVVQAGKNATADAADMQKSIQLGRTAESEARAAVKEAADRVKELADGTLTAAGLRTVASFGSAPGMRATGIQEIIRGSKAFSRAFAEPAFRRMMDGANVPKPQWQNVLERMMIRGLTGPVTAGAGQKVQVR